MKFKEPILVTKSFLPPIDEYVEKISCLWESYWLTNEGKLHTEFIKKLKEYFNIDNLTLCVNGHLSLDIAIKALRLKGEVITTPFTFVSTTNAIALNGLKPVFCDIKYSDYTMDEDKIEELITDKTSAIIPVHVYGMPCNVEKIEEIAKKHNLKVIYDAAHCFGVEVNNRSIANFGDISIFSFHATKVFNSIEGGAIVYKDKEKNSLGDILKNFGIVSQEEVSELGLNAKMNEFQAAMGILNLKYIELEIEKRKKLVNIYRDILKDIPGIRYLEDISGVRHNYSYMPILVDENKYGMTRDILFEKLKEHNVFTRKYFYPLVNKLKCYRDDYLDIRLPVAEYVSERVITLPLYGALKEEAVIEICNIILETSKKS